MPVSNRTAAIGASNSISVNRAAGESLVVAVVISSASVMPSDPSGMTWDAAGDNQPMIYEGKMNMTGGNSVMAVYKLAAPTSVKTGLVTAAYPGGDSVVYRFSVVHLTGMNLSSLVRSSGAFSNTADFDSTHPVSDTIASAVGDTVLDFFVYDLAGPGTGLEVAVGQGDSVLQEGVKPLIGSSTKAGAANVTMGWTQNYYPTYYGNAHIMLSLQPAEAEADTTAPTASTSAVANATPTFVDITMSEAMDAAFTPAASSVTVSGHTVSTLAWASSTVLRATVSAAFVYGEAARTAAYTQPGTNNARDAAGNLLANFSTMSITNNVAATDTTAPTFVSAQVANAAKSDIVITMSETLAAFTPATSAFAASGGRTVTGVARSGPTVTVTVNTPYAYGDTITVTYTKPGSNMLQDAAANESTSFGPSSVTNNIASPTVTITSEAVGKKGEFGVVRASIAYHCTVHHKTTHALIETKTGLTTTAGGGVTFTSTVQVAGTEYLYLPTADADDYDLGAFFGTPV